MNRGLNLFMNQKSGEIESLLFTLQGCIGTGIIAYVIGVSRGKRKAENDVNH